MTLQDLSAPHAEQRRPHHRLTLVAAAIAAIGWTVPAPAQTWNLNANGAWGTAANWLPATVPNAVGAAATLGTIITAPRNVTIGIPITVGSLDFAGAFAYTVTGTNTLTFDVAAGNATIGVTGTAAHVILRPIVLNDTLVVNQGSTGTLRLAGARSGAGGLVKNGTGTLLLNTAASTYAGATQINDGILTYGVGAAIPAGSPVTVGDGVGAAASAQLNIDSAMTAAQALDVTLASDGAVIQANNRLVRLSAVAGSGEVRLNSVVGNGFEITGTGGSTTLSGLVTGGIGVANANPNAGSRFTKIGASTLTLTGANTYVARTFVSGGSLRAASNSALGATSAGFNNATFVYGGGALELAGGITTPERLYLNGAGVGGAGALRNFAGNNTVTGDITIGWTGPGVAAANASIGAEAGTTLTLTGVVNGPNAVTKVGAGTLILNGANTWTGATTVDAGTLQLGQAAALPNATVLTVNGGTLDLNGFSRTVTSLSGTGGAITLGAGTLTVNQAAAGTFAGAISGSGGLVKNGATTLTLTGANGYSGGTTVNAGTLRGDATSLQGNIANGAAVVFDQAAAGTYAGAISGTGTLTKLGAGNLTLTGASTATGATAVNAGTLTVLGSLAAPVTLAAGTTIAGTGAVGALTAGAGATVAPGNPGGTLTANGNYTHNAAAGFRVVVAPSGAGSRLNATGTATLAGGVVDVQAQSGSYARSTRYTILNAAGGVAGTFAGVTSNLAFLTPTLQYDPFNVYLVLASSGVDFATVAQTPNQLAVAAALDNAARAGATGDMATVVNAVSGLSAPQARSAYEAMDGLIHTLLPTIGTSDASQFLRATASRLRDLGGGAVGTGLAWSRLDVALGDAPRSDAPAAYAQAGGPGAPADRSKRGWVSGYGLGGDIDGDASAGDYRYRIGGAIGGVDTDLGGGWVAGLSLAYSDWRVTNGGRGDRADANAYRIGGYARYTDGAFTLDGVLGYGHVRYDTDRRIVFGTIDRTASADYSGDQLLTYVVGRYRFEHDAWGIEPFAAFQWVREWQSGFTEQGAGAVNLAVSSRTLNSTRGTLGARVDRGFESAAGKGMVELRAGYSYEFSGVPSIGATLVGDPTRTGMGIVAETWDRSSWIAGAGVAIAPRKNLTLYADVNGEFQSNTTLWSLLAGLRYTW